MKTLLDINKELKIVFPVHPRTRCRMGEFGIDVTEFHLLEPMPYLEFLALTRDATVVITDSGGIQEETTYLKVPCLTLRDNTERPVTVDLGTNVLVGQESIRLRNEVSRILEGRGKAGTVPPFWDGKASERIADVLEKVLR